MSDQVRVAHRRRTRRAWARLPLALLIPYGSGFVLSAGHHVVTGRPLETWQGWALIALGVVGFGAGLPWYVRQLDEP